MDNSHKNGGRINMIAHYMRGSVIIFFVSVVFSILNTFFNSLTPQVIKITVDSIIDSKPFHLPGGLSTLLTAAKNNGTGLWIGAGSILFIAAITGICGYFSRIGLAKGSETFVKKLRDGLFEHIQKLPFSWHVQHQTGEIIQRCTSDVDVIRNFITNQFMEVFRTVFLIILSLSIMFSMNIKISLITLGFIPIVIAYTAIFFSKIAKRFRYADEAEGALSSTVQENLTGVRVVRAFGREKFEIERFDEKNNQFANFWITLGNVQSYYWAIGDFITGLQLLTVVIFGTIECVHGNITLGEFLAFVSYNTSLSWPVRSLGRIISEMSKAGVSIDRVKYILDAKEEEDAANALTPPMNGDIEFHHITFSYEQDTVLKDLNFKIAAGSTFAILGGTGSGKSTLMYLLGRLYDLPPQNGKITIGEVDIADMKRSWIRKNIGMVLQEPFLFSRTIQENITLPHPNAPIDEIRGAARIACVDEAVEDFPDGYDTIVGERGVTLSGGQKQRVAIARMLMQQAPIMVFDDSLSAVDSETDSQIRRALKNKLGTATVILISHRITTLMQADQILVLEDGKAVEIGTHDELIRREGIYKRIYDIQMSSDDRVLLGKKEE